MNAIVLCGGRGSRLRADGIETEKPLVEVCGQQMLGRVHRALAGSRVGTIHAAVSPEAPETREYARERFDSVVETAGEGYVADLETALDAVGRPVLTVAADLPLLVPGVVDRVLSVAERAGTDGDGDLGSDVSLPSITVCVPTAVKRRLGGSIDATIPADVVESATFVGSSIDSGTVEQYSDGGGDVEQHPDEGREIEQRPGEERTVTLSPTGVNVVGDPRNNMWVSHDVRLTVNGNRSSDVELAEALCT